MECFGVFMVCNICPKKCGVDRKKKFGACGVSENLTVSKIMVHFWEEPPISGSRGSGAVFFTGCNLRCVFCQNHRISRAAAGMEISPDELCDIFFQLKADGVHNINLVSPAHYSGQISRAIMLSRQKGFDLPFVYNTNGYESVETLRTLEGVIDVYLPDIKYSSSEAAFKYSGVKDYFEKATLAVMEMSRQVGTHIFNDEGIMVRGLMIRHLVLPGLRKDSMKILDWIAANLPDSYVSIMSQYIPVNKASEFKEINRRITTFEYTSVVNHFQKLGLTNGFFQEVSSASKEFVPEF